MQNPKHTKKQAVSTIAVTGSAFWGKPYKTNGAKNVRPEIFLRDKIQNEGKFLHTFRLILFLFQKVRRHKKRRLIAFVFMMG